MFYSLCSPRYLPEIEIEIDHTQLRFLSIFFPVSLDVSFRFRRYVVLSVSGLATGLLSVMRVMEDCGWSIGKIFVYKYCFCYLNVQHVKQKNPLFNQPSPLVGILITIGCVPDIFAIRVCMEISSSNDIYFIKFVQCMGKLPNKDNGVIFSYPGEFERDLRSFERI